MAELVGLLLLRERLLWLLTLGLLETLRAAAESELLPPSRWRRRECLKGGSISSSLRLWSSSSSI